MSTAAPEAGRAARPKPKLEPKPKPTVPPNLKRSGGGNVTDPTWAEQAHGRVRLG